MANKFDVKLGKNAVDHTEKDLEDGYTEIDLSGLKPNSSNTYDVYYAGKDEPSKAAIKTNDVKPGTPVIKLTAGDKKITVEIVDGSNQGSAVKSRKLYYTDGTTSKTLDANAKTDITGLVNGTEYSVQATTTNGAGESNKSTPSKATPVAPVVHVTGVSVDKSEVSVEEGASATVKATVAPSNATDKTVTWKSGNAETATVDNNGKITGVKAGTVNVAATTKDGSKTATVAVTVTAKPTE